MKSLYRLIEDANPLSFNYLTDIKEYRLFMPIIEIHKVEADPANGVEEFEYTRDQVIKMIKFVVRCFSKDSPYLKTSDTVNQTKILVMEELGIDDLLKKRILAYKIPELDTVIKNYIEREDDEFIREYLIAKNIYDRNLHESSNPNLITDSKQAPAFFKVAEDFKKKMFELKQQVENSNPAFYNMKKDFIKNVKSLHVVDLV